MRDTLWTHAQLHNPGVRVSDGRDLRLPSCGIQAPTAVSDHHRSSSVSVQRTCARAARARERLRSSSAISISFGQRPCLTNLRGRQHGFLQAQQQRREQFDRPLTGVAQQGQPAGSAAHPLIHLRARQDRLLILGQTDEQLTRIGWLTQGDCLKHKASNSRRTTSEQILG